MKMKLQAKQKNSANKIRLLYNKSLYSIAVILNNSAVMVHCGYKMSGKWDTTGKTFKLEARTPKPRTKCIKVLTQIRTKIKRTKETLPLVKKTKYNKA